MYTCDIKRMEDKIKTFSKFGDTGHGGITRFSLSPEAIMARNEIKSRMTKLGLDFKTDDMGDIYCTLPGSDPDAKVIMSGSHCDSVRQGGNYDGILGVMTAMEAIETIVVNKIPHKHPIQLVVWTNEEGARFEPAMMCSGVVTGKFDKDAMLASEAKDIPGYTFGQALKESGFEGSKENRVNPDKTAGLIELHIEQGNRLEEENRSIGIVTGIVGLQRYKITVQGKSNHSGTTLMEYRDDALVKAAKIIAYCDEQAKEYGQDLVATVSAVTISPNALAVINGNVEMTLECRNLDENLMHQYMEDAEETVLETGNTKGEDE